jgi:hypothetical protein
MLKLPANCNVISSTRPYQMTEGFNAIPCLMDLLFQRAEQKGQE